MIFVFWKANIQLIITVVMSASELHTNNRQTQKSLIQIDFRPPQHSYVVNEPFTSAFFRDHCQQQYTIHRAFNSSNFTYLRQNIPNELKHGAILNQRLNKVQNNMEYEMTNRQKPFYQKQQQLKMKAHRKKMEQIGQLGYFEVFPYQQSQYDLEHQLKLRQQQQNKKKQQEISSLTFRPAGFDKKGKYENPFTHVDRLEGKTLYKEEYLFPFHLPDDTYDRFHQSELRQRIIEQSSKLAGDFIPSKTEKSLTRITRSKGAQILQEIEDYLKKYLTKLGFFIGMSKRDYIDILFESKEANNNKVHMVMSHFCESQSLCKYMLKRNVTRWGRVGDTGYLQYSVIPPWVKEPQQKLNKE